MIDINELNKIEGANIKKRSYDQQNNYNSYSKYSNSNKNKYNNNTQKTYPPKQHKQLDKLTYVDDAEKVIKTIQDSKKDIIITNSKIRNVLTLINELYNMAKMDKNDKLNEDIQSHIQYIRMKLTYEAGRDKGVKKLLYESDMLYLLKNVGDSREKLMLICHYMEALVAYHKYWINKE